MKIDCSKLSNKDDLLMFIGLVIIAILIITSVYLAIYVDSFVAGFFSATIIFKWHGWIFIPIDKRLDKLRAKH